MKISVVISLGTSVLMLVSAWTASASASADTVPSGKSPRQNEICSDPQPDTRQPPWSKNLSARRDRQPRPKVTRHIFDHGGYRPGNW
jgi:hypothetical protein